MTVLLHTSDTHLGYHQYHLEQRADDFAAAFKQVIHDAIDLNVDAIVHSGDMFHDSNPRIGPLLQAIQQLRRLQAAEIPFLTVAGNHDSTRDAQWVSVFSEVADAIHLGQEPTIIGDVAIYGQDYVSPLRRDQLTYDFEQHDAAHGVLVAHGAFDPLVRHGKWSLPTVLSSASIGFDVALLGDDHTPVYQNIGGTFVTYPGSTERTATDQREERGYTLVQFGIDARTGDERQDRDEVCPDGISYDRRPLSTRPHEYVDIEASEDQAVADTVRTELQECDLDGAVVAVTITGEGEPVTVGPLEDYAEKDLGALVARVSDRRQRGSGRVAIDVSFANPDDAVERRRKTLGLSTVVDELEQQARAETPVDSNLQGAVKEEVETRIEEEPESFDPVEPELTMEELREQTGTIEDLNSDAKSESERADLATDGADSSDVVSAETASDCESGTTPSSNTDDSDESEPDPDDLTEEDAATETGEVEFDDY